MRGTNNNPALPGMSVATGVASRGDFMRCQDIMSRPVQFCRDDETVQAAARKMVDFRIGFLPISDAHGQVVGTLTDRDIAVRVAAEDRSASETRIADVMTPEVVSCRPSNEIEEAKRLMSRYRKSRIIVLSGGVLVGVISLADLAQSRETGAGQTLRAVSAREVLDVHGMKPRLQDGV